MRSEKCDEHYTFFLYFDFPAFLRNSLLPQDFHLLLYDPFTQKTKGQVNKGTIPCITKGTVSLRDCP